MDEKKLTFIPTESDSNVISVGGSVETVKVSLRFLGDNLNPEEISALLQCQPSKAYRKGDTIGSKRSHRIAHTGAWILKGTKEDTGVLETKITRLLECITVPLTVWEELRSFSGNVFCGIFINDWNRGLSLSPELMQKLVERHLSIDFDIYCNFFEEDEKSRNPPV
ncbi:MAG: DUF4279 domain-containing protein [Oscillatoria sp. PMC 1051.18]|nr:DUF4279 domain-containing protein [Oscillatoria sp. PMC 1050.18]MEC5031184.1 DUF4279 domain-containing protein [Oscillatoria sp. PMC 1051.18]